MPILGPASILSVWPAGRIRLPVPGLLIRGRYTLALEITRTLLDALGVRTCPELFDAFYDRYFGHRVEVNVGNSIDEWLGDAPFPSRRATCSVPHRARRLDDADAEPDTVSKLECYMQSTR